MRWLRALPIVVFELLGVGAQAQDRAPLAPDTPVEITLKGTRAVFDIPGPALGLYEIDVAFQGGPFVAALGGWPDGQPDGDAKPEVLARDRAVTGPLTLGPYILHPDVAHRLLVQGHGEATVRLIALDTPAETEALALEEGRALLTRAEGKREGTATLAGGDAPLWLEVHGEPGKTPQAYLRQETDAGRRNIDWTGGIAGPLTLTADPGTLWLRPGKDGEGRYAYLRLSRDRFEGIDERGREWETAAMAEPGVAARGLLLKPGEADLFRFEVPAGQEATTLTVRGEGFFSDFGVRLLKPPYGNDDTVLILSAEAGMARGEALHLAPGPYGLRIARGKEAGGFEPYTVLVDDAPPAAPGIEREPNQRAAEATMMPADGRIAGMLDRDDIDVVAFEVDDPDQLWRLQLNGGNRMVLSDARGRTLATLTRPAAARHVRAEGLDLLPGRYTATITGDGEYRLRLRSLGTPPADFEREPNDDQASALRIEPGSFRRGLLPWGDAADRYVFQVSGRDRYALTVEAPDDAALDIALLRGGGVFGEQRLAPGGTMRFESELEAESYTLVLSGRGVAGQGLYRIALDLIEPDPAVTDHEPNSWYGDALPIPPGGRIVGTTQDMGARDYYHAPAPETPGWLIHSCPPGSEGEWQQGFIAADALARPRGRDSTAYEGNRIGLSVVENTPGEAAAWLAVYRTGAYDCRLHFDPAERNGDLPERIGTALAAERDRARDPAPHLAHTGTITEEQGSGYDAFPLALAEDATGALWRCTDDATGDTVPAHLHDGADWMKNADRDGWSHAQFAGRKPGYLMVGGRGAVPGAYSCALAPTRVTAENFGAMPEVDGPAEGSAWQRAGDGDDGRVFRFAVPPGAQMVHATCEDASGAYYGGWTPSLDGAKISNANYVDARWRLYRYRVAGGAVFRITAKAGAARCAARFDGEGLDAEAVTVREGDAPVPPVTAPTLIRERIGRAGEVASIPLSLPGGSFYGADCTVEDGPEGTTLSITRPARDRPVAYGDRVLAVMPEDGTGALRIKAGAKGYDWTRPIDIACTIRPQDTFTPHPPPAPEPGWTTRIDLEQTAYAAYSPRGQTLAGTLTVTNADDAAREIVLDARATGRGWWISDLPPSLTLEPGAERALAFTLALPPFADEGPGARVVAMLDDPADAHAPRAARSAILAGDAEATPVSPGPFRETPLVLEGGLNLLDRRLGARLVEANGKAVNGDKPEYWRDRMHDGDPAQGSAQHSPGGDLIYRLAGEEAVPLRGLAFSMRLSNGLNRWARDLRVELSMDGEAWTAAGALRLEAVHERQFIVFDAPVPTRFVRILVDRSVWATESSYMNEVMAIAEPGFIPASLAPIDLAAPRWGGVLVGQSLREQIYESPTGIMRENSEIHARSRPLAEPVTEGEAAPPPAPRYWITGFADMRAARIAGFEWVTTEGEAKGQPPHLDVSISTGTVADFDDLVTLPRPGDGAITRRVMLDEPVWARFVRFEVPGNDGHALPRVVRIFEAEPGDAYLPAPGMWNEDSPRGPYERFADPLDPLPAKRGGRSAETATPTAPDADIASRARYGEDGEDWFSFTVEGEGPRALLLAMDGGAALRQTAVALFDANGEPVTLEEPPRVDVERLDPAPDGIVWRNGREDRAIRRATLDPGAYTLRVSVPGRLLRVRQEDVGTVRNRRPAINRAFRRWAEELGGPDDAVSFPERSEWEDGDGFVRGRDNLLRALNAPPFDAGGGTSSFATAMEQEARAYRGLDGAKQTVGFATGAIFSDAADFDYPDVIAREPVSFTGMMLPCYAFGCPNTRFAADRMRAAPAATGGRFARISRSDDIERTLAATLVSMSDWRGHRLSLDLRAPPPVATGPGSLLLVRAEGVAGDDGNAGGAAPGRAVALVLDASGSMLRRMPTPEAPRRIAVARDSLSRVVRDLLPDGTPFVFRAFGLREDACDSRALVPFGTLDRGAALDAIGAVPAINLAKTPIAKSLRLAGEDMAGHGGAKSIVLVTDGEETCDGDVPAAIRDLRDGGVALRLDIVGFAIDDAALKAEFAQWATLGGGVYFDAADARSLEEALTEAAVPEGYTLLGEDGSVVATGRIGEPLEASAGTWRIRFDDPALTAREVVIAAEEQTELTIAP